MINCVPFLIYSPLYEPPLLHEMWVYGGGFSLFFLSSSYSYLSRNVMHDCAWFILLFFGMFFFFPSCSLDRPISKRCASLSTCVLGKLSQELHKLQTYPRTDVGAGTPGKKRNVLNDLENERYANYGESLGNN